MKTKLPNIASNSGRFIDGNPATGTLGTIVTADWLNGVQDNVQDMHEELKAVLDLAAVPLNTSRKNQLAVAIETLLRGKQAADKAYQVDKANQNRSLNTLLGQNTIWGTGGRTAETLGLTGIYTYGVGLAMSAGGANAMLYIPHSHAGVNNGVWVQATYAGNGAQPFWRRIDGADWSEVRNPPDFLLKSGGKMSGTLEIKNGDWSKLMLTNSANKPLIFESQPDNTETFGSFFYRGEGGQKEAETKLPKAFGTLALREDFTYQKIGNFEIRKYPDGTMIQSFRRYFVANGQNVMSAEIVWGQAFVERSEPIIHPSVTIQEVVSEANKQTVLQGNYDALNISVSAIKVNNTGVIVFAYDSDGINSNFYVDVTAIGRWK